MRNRFVKLILLAICSFAFIPSLIWAAEFYECVHNKTGEKRFTDGALPSNDWTCKGFGMERGGYFKSGGAKAQTSSSPSRSASGSGKPPEKSIMMNLIKRSQGTK